MADKHLLNVLLKKVLHQFKLILQKFPKELFDRAPSGNYF